MLNVTRQNTSFNSRPHNLNPEAPRLGVDKKVTPLITVRPFGHRNDTNTSAPINKVSPMKNGELVEAKNNMAITLNSDGASTESSSSEEEISRPTSGLERQFLKAKQSAATARLSFLNSTITEANKGQRFFFFIFHEFLKNNFDLDYLINLESTFLFFKNYR